MRKIKLTKNKYAIVDDEDLRFLSNFSWTVDGSDNVSTNFKVNGAWVRIPMSRFLYKPKIQYKVSYKNKNPLDNRKENIALITTQQFNGTSAKMYTTLRKLGKIMLRNPTSKYKGVCKNSDPRYKTKKWKGTIQCHGKAITKLFEKENDAAKWYNEMAKEFFGESAYQNIINN